MTKTELKDIIRECLVDIEEGNAFNRYAADKTKEVNYHSKRGQTFGSLGSRAGDRKAEDEYEKAHNANINGYSYIKGGNRYHNDWKNTDAKFNHGGSKKGDNDIPDDFKEVWMRDHGNRGKSPEERYKSGRYLDAQKKLREAMDIISDLQYDEY